TSTTGSAGSTMNHEQMNGAGANGGPMASGTSGGSHMSNSAAGGASSTDIRQAQEALQDHGLYKGQVDGKWGPQTKRAVAQFQKQKGLKQTAQLDQQTLNDLQNDTMSGSDNSSSGPSTASRGRISVPRQVKPLPSQASTQSSGSKMSRSTQASAVRIDQCQPATRARAASAPSHSARNATARPLVSAIPISVCAATAINAMNG